MGSGIGLTAAMNGLEAYQCDTSSEQLERARAYHAKTLARSVQKERLTQEQADEVAARVRYETSLSELSGADWAVEAATEDLLIKKEIFQAMRDAFRDDAVLATNAASSWIT